MRPKVTQGQQQVKKPAGGQLVHAGLQRLLLTGAEWTAAIESAE